MSAVGVDAKVKSWSPAVPCKIPDNIVSSKFTTAKVFVPSYEKDKRPCMEHLLTNEYQRVWWQEKETWDKMFTRKTTTKTLLQRMTIRRKPPMPPTVEKHTKKSKKLTRAKELNKSKETIKDPNQEEKSEVETTNEEEKINSSA